MLNNSTHRTFWFLWDNIGSQTVGGVLPIQEKWTSVQTVKLHFCGTYTTTWHTAVYITNTFLPSHRTCLYIKVEIHDHSHVFQYINVFDRLISVFLICSHLTVLIFTGSVPPMSRIEIEQWQIEWQLALLPPTSLLSPISFSLPFVLFHNLLAL